MNLLLISVSLLNRRYWLKLKKSTSQHQMKKTKQFLGLAVEKDGSMISEAEPPSKPHIT